MFRAAKSYPVLTYFVLAAAWFWASLALDRIKGLHFWAPLVGALAPAISAIFVTAITQSEAAVRQLGRKLWHWRVGWRWYLAALGIPLAEALLAVSLAKVGGAFEVRRIDMVMLRASIPALWVVFLFAAAEELGWRGFALPELLRHNSAVKATLMVGGMHALWHWPLILLPKMWLSDIPVLPWTISVLAEAFLFTWIIRGTGGSVMLAALFHGMTNLAMLIFGGITPHSMPWLKCGVTVAATVCLLLATGTDLKRQSNRRAYIASA
ncbi:MAG: type II CAAX prenyl endopeptidase Rce1 family protein [Terriglobales bacterium]